LNYVLLDHPKLVKSNEKDPSLDESGNTTETDNTNVTNSSTSVVQASIVTESANTTYARPGITTLEVNTTGKRTGIYMETMFRNNDLQQGRARNYEKKKADKALKEKQLEILKKSTQVTSGILACTGCFTLDEDLRDKQREYRDRENLKQQQIQMKKDIQQQQETNKFRASYRKYISNLPLSTTDMKTLIKRVKTKDDSPLRSRMVDIHQQWNRRKHRYDDFNVNSEAVPVNIGAATLPRELVLFEDLNMKCRSCRE
jgi:hypothetical protein